MAALTHEFTFPLPASREQVFAALISPDELRRWFAEHAEVEPRVGGAYRFWGKHTYGTPSREQATQVVTRIEPDRLLAYRWRLVDCDSEVTLELSPGGKNGETTTLKGVHHFSQAPQGHRVHELVEDLWKLHGSNLAAHLKGAAGLLLPDYADPSPTIRLTILIDAPRERVFKALLDPAMLNRWIAASAFVEPRVGGAYRFGWNYKVGDRDVVGGPTRILELVENERLVTDWPDWRGDPDSPPTQITWLLESVGKQTRVTLMHGVFPRAADFSDYGAGWHHLLVKLKEAFEKG